MIRETEYKIDRLFPRRWSPRAMSGAEISDQELMSLFEAARWAPSANNNQPWRFVYAKRNTPEWNIFFNLISDGNKIWCKNAAVLVVIISQMISDYKNKPIKTHSFDTGAAWENLALQGTIMNLVIHGMAGFDYDKAKEKLDVPEEYCVEAMIAIGKPGKKEDLPVNLQEREVPSDRKRVLDFVFRGVFGN